MAEAPRKIQLSYEAYLALEQETGERHEYLDGEAWAMAGGNVPHSCVKGNLYALLRTALLGRPCRPMDSDLKIYVPSTGLVTYPDVSVICGALLGAVGAPHADTMPTLLAEVLSPRTESWGRAVHPRGRRLLAPDRARPRPAGGAAGPRGQLRGGRLVRGHARGAGWPRGLSGGSRARRPG